MNRNDSPLPNRNDTRPRELTVTGPTRFDAETPEPEMFNAEVGEVLIRLRKMKPMAGAFRWEVRF